MKNLKNRIEEVCKYEIMYIGCDDESAELDCCLDVIVITNKDIYANISQSPWNNDAYIFQLNFYGNELIDMGYKYEGSADEIVNLCRTESIDFLTKPYNAASDEISRLVRNTNLTF